jgi:hypothetical protein
MFGDQPDYTGAGDETIPQAPVQLPGPFYQAQPPFSPGPSSGASPVGSAPAGSAPWEPGRFAAGQHPGSYRSAYQRSTIASSGNPLERLKQLWRADPAYKVLMVAVAIVLISGIALMIGLGNLFKGSSPSSPQGPGATANLSAVQTATAAVIPTPAPTLAPTPTATPRPTPTPIPVIPTLEPTPTSPPVQQELLIEITDIPDSVDNNDTASVTVHTTRPGAQVVLTVTYTNAFPVFYNSNPETTDANGDATISWEVNVQSFGRNKTIKATVTAVVSDETGQQKTSESVKVTINNQNQ